MTIECIGYDDYDFDEEVLVREEKPGDTGPSTPASDFYRWWP